MQRIDVGAGWVIVWETAGNGDDAAHLMVTNDAGATW
jgi:hypothetical protein